MSIIINTFYLSVLALANKEQKGYITPQEFNLFAKHAQMSIFEQYFYDLNQFKRIQTNDTEAFDMINLIEEKLNSIFLRQLSTTSAFKSYGADLPSDFYRLHDCFYRQTSSPLGAVGNKVEHMERQQAVEIGSSGPLTRPTINTPISYIFSGRIYMRPIVVPSPPNTAFFMSYYRKPKDPKWTYVVLNEKPMFNASGGVQDFELHQSEETNLVLKILQLAGISVKDFGTAQAAAQIENNKIVQQKQ
jgi:hypothetical protein